MTDPENTANMAKPPVETERKFLIDPSRIPEEVQLAPREQIRQGYLVIGADGSEARVRDRAGAYTVTVKSKGDLSRGEFETRLASDQFEALWPATAGKRVEKTRYSVPYGPHLIELDVYVGDLVGLVVAEVEFAAEEEAVAFEPPEWFGQDVTTHKGFKNQSLAVAGIPTF